MKYILFILILILCSSLVYGGECSATYMNNHIKAFYNFTETSKPYNDSLTATSLDTGNNPDRYDANALGFIYDYGQDFERSNSDKVYDANPSLYEFTNFSVIGWFYPEDITQTSDMLTVSYFDYNGNNRKGWSCGFYNNNGNYFCNIWNGVGLYDQTYSDVTINAGVWYHISLVWDGDINLWINYSNASGVFSAGNDGISAIGYSGSEDFEISDIYWSAGFLNRYYDGKIHGLMIFDVALNETCINYTYNNHYPFSEPPVLENGTDINITINSLPNNTYSSYTTPTYNFKFVSNSINTANCSLFRNDSYVNSTITINNTNTDLSDLISIDTLYIYYINCSNSTTSNITGYYNYILDTIPPNITYFYPENLSHYNSFSIPFYGSLSYPNNDYIHSYLNWSETNAYEIGGTPALNCSASNNISMFYPNGTLINLLNYTYFDTLTGITFYKIQTITGIPQEFYMNYNITCFDLANNSITLYNITFYYDNSNPIINLYSPLDIDYLVYTNDTFFNLSYYDTYLWKSNTTITNLNNNSVVYNRYTENNSIDYQYENFSFILNLSDVGYNDFMAFFEVVDKHTDTNFNEKPDIQEIDIYDSTERIYKYPMDDGNIFFITDNKTTIKENYETDRITQEFIYSEKIIKPVERYFDIQAGNIIYFPDSPYKCHMILNYKGMDSGYWYDCEGLNDTRVEQISKGYRIYYTIYPEIKSISKSLGGLNYINKTLYFSFFNTTITPTNISALENEIENLRGEVNMIALFILWAIVIGLSLYVRSEVMLILSGLLGFFIGSYLVFNKSDDIPVIVSGIFMAINIFILYIANEIRISNKR